ncbi:hypothetical protein THRCLA_03825 [Thraustotheca clavata]|uniref:RNB domain-containing protein n=1 Tax=Thraustotheca clavata TaxID=74557 RepID=A0A1W0A0S2_9STRA|nr:hypothetical protein THRCLA_03825 [Thraustotheca clavata]
MSDADVRSTLTPKKSKHKYRMKKKAENEQENSAEYSGSAGPSLTVQELTESKPTKKKIQSKTPGETKTSDDQIEIDNKTMEVKKHSRKKGKTKGTTSDSISSDTIVDSVLEVDTVALSFQDSNVEEKKPAKASHVNGGKKSKKSQKDELKSDNDVVVTSSSKSDNENLKNTPRKDSKRNKKKKAKNNVFSDAKPKNVTLEESVDITSSKSENEKKSPRKLMGNEKKSPKQASGKNGTKKTKNEIIPDTMESKQNAIAMNHNNITLVKSNNAKKPSNSNPDYIAHISAKEAAKGLADGKYLQGTLRISKLNRHDGFITIDGLDVDINIKSITDQNRAVDGDEVVVEILPQEQWKSIERKLKEVSSAPISIVPSLLWNPLVEPTTPKKVELVKNTLYETLTELQRHIKSEELQPTAKVVHIAKKVDRVYIGTIRPAENAALFDAKDPRLPCAIRIPLNEMPREYKADPETYAKTMLCIIKLGKWSAAHRAPQGIFVETTGLMGTITPEINAILAAADLREHMLPFSKAVESSLPSPSWSISAKEIAKRRDLRDWTIFSIDPWNARDLDDAMSIRPVSDDIFEIGVHIADVSHFVTEDSLVDLEAKERCTSVYLVNQVLPMLPRLLCESLCSLQPYTDRLAFSVIWHMHSNGMFVKDAPVWYGKTIIRSVCQLDYGTAQKLIEKPLKDASYSDKEWPLERRPKDVSLEQEIHRNVKELWTVGMARRKVRFESGSVSLQNTKLSFILDPKTGNPVSVSSYPIRDSNRLIEEFMLVANYLVAQKLLMATENSAVLRFHPPPDSKLWRRAWESLEKMGIVCDPEVKLSTWLDSVLKTRGELVYTFVMHVLTKPMQSAQYSITEDLTEDDRHFALNIPYYTHFTSPIRRYADVLVHRLLQASLEHEKVNLSPLVVDRCNVQKYNAKVAQQECDKLFLAMYLVEYPCEDTAIVLHVGVKFFTVLLVKFGFEQRLYLDKLGLTGKMDEVAGQLILHKDEKSLQIRPMSTVTLHLSASAQPINLVFSLVL